MSIVIHGMKMPRFGECIVITSDGFARKYLTGEVMIYYDATPDKVSTAAELPPHGRLIDADAFLARNAYFADREFVNPKYDDTLRDLVDAADTILQADPEGADEG